MILAFILLILQLKTTVASMTSTDMITSLASMTSTASLASEYKKNSIHFTYWVIFWNEKPNERIISQMPPIQDSQITFKPNLACISLSSIARYIISNPDETPCMQVFCKIKLNKRSFEVSENLLPTLYHFCLHVFPLDFLFLFPSFL